MRASRWGWRGIADGVRDGGELRACLGKLPEASGQEPNHAYVRSTTHHFASTTNHDDATWAWSTGGGLLIQLSSGRTPIALDIGTRYHSNGSVEYLKSGDIEDHPDGSISINPTRSEANLMTINLGVSVGLRPGGN